VRSCLFTGINRSRSQGLLAAHDAAWSKIPLESGPSRRQLQARQPPCRTAMSDTHHIGSARNLWPHASSETGHRCQTAPGSKRQCFINRRRRSRTPVQLLPGGCLARSRPRREPVSSRWPAPASAPRRDERLAGRGPGTTWVRAPGGRQPWDNVEHERLAGGSPRTTWRTSASRAAALRRRRGRAPCGPRLSDDVQDERLAGGPRPWDGAGDEHLAGRGRVPGRDQVRMHSTGPMSEVLQLGSTSPKSKVFPLGGRGPYVRIRAVEQLTTLDPLCPGQSPCPRHLPDRGRAGRVTPPAG
jgi:hypothetical protein